MCSNIEIRKKLESRKPRENKTKRQQDIVNREENGKWWRQTEKPKKEKENMLKHRESKE